MDVRFSDNKTDNTMQIPDAPHPMSPSSADEQMGSEETNGLEQMPGVTITAGANENKLENTNNSPDRNTQIKGITDKTSPISPMSNQENENGALESPGGRGSPITPNSPTPRHPIDATIQKMVPDMGYPTVGEYTFKWHIKSWRELSSKSEKEYGPKFTCAGYQWRLLCFPRGNSVDSLSLYLDFADKETMEEGWGVCAQFLLFVANPHDDSSVHAQYSSHRFDSTESDWGFTKFLPLAKLHQADPANGIPRPLIEDDQTVLMAYVRVIKDETGILWHSFKDYDSKKVTGYVGLKNQGATCYMNSLLQSLYLTNFFRKSVFQIPTENDEPSQSVALALQRVFYQLMTSDTPVGTLELTKSFGWDTIDAFMQHDVQEFNRVLQDNLEGKMKGTPAENAIAKLFVGKMKSYIKCVDVDYESSRTENYYDIQLNVKGCKTLEESFKEYCAEETMEGENKYMAEGFGLQDARKGVKFLDFPPVLHLQLKRFEYDIKKGTLVKINDRHEFPTEVDLSEFIEDGEEKKDMVYKLHGVLVHSGDLSGGHYCAFIKPEPEGKWLKFDDDRVIPVRETEATEDNFGGESGPNAMVPIRYPTPGMRGPATYKRFTNAYMLVYIRASALNEILAPVLPEDVPEHLPQRLEEERRREEERDREMRESHLYLKVHVTSDALMREHHAFDLAEFETKDNSSSYDSTPMFSRNNTPKPPPPTKSGCRTFRLRKAMTIREFREKMCEDLDIKDCNLWVMSARQNRTTRPDTLISAEDDNLKLSDVREKHLAHNRSDLKLYVEDTSMAVRLDGERPTDSKEAKDSLFLVFLKHYDPAKMEITIIGHTYVKKTETAPDIVPFILHQMEWSANTPLRLFEEIRPTMIEEIKHKMTFENAEIVNGDIIAFQRDLSPEELESMPNPTRAVPDYYDWLLYKVSVTFKPRPNSRDFKAIQNKENQSPAGVNGDGEFVIELSKRMQYDAVAEKVAAELKVDPLKIRFSMEGTGPRMIKRKTEVSLLEMLNAGYIQSSPAVLYYETLEVPITELDYKKFLTVNFLGPTLKDERTVEVFANKTGTVSEIQEALVQKLKHEASGDKPNGQPLIGSRGASQIRVWAVTSHKIDKEFSADYPIANIQDYSTLYAEEIPPEEDEMEKGDFVVGCIHFSKALINAHSAPFRFVIKHGERFEQTKRRLQTRLGLPDKEFAKIKFTVVPHVPLSSKMRYLNDDDVLSDSIEEKNELLALDHPDRTIRSRSGGMEKAIKIFN